MASTSRNKLWASCALDEEVRFAGFVRRETDCCTMLEFATRRLWTKRPSGDAHTAHVTADRIPLTIGGGEYRIVTGRVNASFGNPSLCDDMGQLRIVRRLVKVGRVLRPPTASMG